MRFPVPPPVLNALKRFKEGGAEAYLVGGCVRDDYLGVPPHDYDICTSALPDEVERLFSDVPVIKTGLKHGTVTLVFGKMCVEATTFRTESQYSDGRHPDSVIFTPSLQNDLLRRDFTMNALAWSPDTGVVDLFGGLNDLNNGLIRCVGNAEDRFREDALRILRALRFSSQLGFDIEPKAAEAMESLRETLHKISRERVRAELDGVLMGKHPAEAFRAHPRVFFEVLPGLAPMLHCPQKSPFHCYDVWEHTLHALACAERELACRWAVLFHDAGKPAAVTYDPDGTTHFRGHPQISTRLAKEAMESLRQPVRLTNEVAALALYHDERIGPDNVHYYLSKLGPELFFKLLSVKRADLAAHAPHIAARLPQIDETEARARKLLSDGACLGLKDLAVDGRALMEAGFPPSPLLGGTLDYLLERVVRGEAPNERAHLLSLALLRLQSKQSPNPK